MIFRQLLRTLTALATILSGKSVRAVPISGPACVTQYGIEDGDNSVDIAIWEGYKKSKEIGNTKDQP